MKLVVLLLSRGGALFPGARDITSPRLWSSLRMQSRMLQRSASAVAAQSASVMLAFCQTPTLFLRLYL